MNKQFVVAYYDKMLTQWRSRQFQDQNSAEEFIEFRIKTQSLYQDFQLIITYKAEAV